MTSTRTKLRRVREPLALVALAALAPSSPACGPRISVFDQRTQVLCPGQEAELPFRARGDLKMVVRVDDPRLAPQAGENPDPRAPDTVTVTVIAGDEAAKASFLAVARSWPETVAFDALPPADGAIVAQGTKDPAWWGADRFEVAAVAAPPGRDLEVRQAGRAAAIPGGGSSQAFLGTPLGGDWELRSALTERERSGVDPPATSLRVSVTAQCKAAR